MGVHMRKYTLVAAALLLAGASPAAFAQDQAGAVSLQDAVRVAVESNPEIIQAQMNTEAIQFERKQAQGQFMPRIDMEASAGVRRLENNTRRILGIADNELYPVEVGLNADWTVIDFGRRRGEVLRQAARVDGASLRVVERSEFIALQIARQYFNILLQQRVVAAARDNTAFHQALVYDLGQGVDQGSISIADRQQAEERLQAALVNEQQAALDLEQANITLRRLTGLDITQVTMPPNLASSLPANVDLAVGRARTEHPLVREAVADVDAANAASKSAEAELYPTIGVEVRSRIGHDVDGFSGATNDVLAQGVFKWNIWDGGINRANLQEKIRQASQARYRLMELQRQAEEDVRTAWATMNSQSNIVTALTRQTQVSDDLLLSYRSQFNVGRRSLLDVLDAQNTRYNTQVKLETSRFSQLFAQYQALAATNLLLDALGVPPGAGSGMKERERFNFGPPVPAELQRRTNP